MSSRDELKLPEPKIKIPYTSIVKEEKVVAGKKQIYLDSFYSKKFVDEYMKINTRKK